MYMIDHTIKTALHIQLYVEIKKDIIENYKVGDKLPSIRKLASLYNLSKNTVANAYSQLVVEGYIDSYAKSGYIVEDTNASSFKLNIKAHNLEENIPEFFKYDFDPTRLSNNSFPLKTWKRLFNKYITEDVALGAYTCGQGEFALRTEIVKYLNKSRGVNCHVEQIVLGCGFTDSMGLLSRLVHKKYDTLATENPGYNVVRRVFEAYGYKINKVPIDHNGILLDELKKQEAKMVYVTPSHQYPTGVTMPISNRHKLLEWAVENDGLIIEDDYDSELAYINRPIPSLQGLDEFDRVVYVGTFSKSFSAPLRISYMVLPKHLLEEYKKDYHNVFSSVPLMIQKTLEKFMNEGHWDRHLRKIRTVNRRKHNLMKSILEENLSDSIIIEAQGAGLSILINPKIKMDFEKLKELAKKERMKLYFAKAVCGGDWDAVRMGFGVFKENEIKEAVEVFCKVWKRCISN